MDEIEEFGHNFAALKKGLTRLSAAKEWSEVVKEWELFDAYTYRCEGTPTYSLGQCLCNHPNIVEHCVLRNRITDQTAIVGNVCVKRFLNKDSTKFFDCVKRIRSDVYAAPNDAAIELMAARGLIDDWDKRFLKDTKRKRNPTTRQKNVRKRINERLLEHLEKTATSMQTKLEEKAAAAGETGAA